MRSVLIAIFELRADEVFVVAHHDCGMNNINPSKTIEKMVTRGGIKPESAWGWAAGQVVRCEARRLQLLTAAHPVISTLTAPRSLPCSARGAVVRGHRRQEVPARL